MQHNEPYAPMLNSSSLIIEALTRGQLSAREAADLLGELQPIRRPKVGRHDDTVAVVRAALIRTKQQPHAVVMMRRLGSVKSENAARMILSEYAELI